MNTSIVLGNQSIVVNLNDHLEVTDFYFPRVGQENQLFQHRNRVGVWVDGTLSWLNERGWVRESDYRPGTLVAERRATSKVLGLSLEFLEGVHPTLAVFFRRVTVRDRSGERRTARLFFNQDFHIYGHNIGDTATYDPDSRGIVHYKNRRYLLVTGFRGERLGLDDWTVAPTDRKDHGGSLQDAEDGVLEQRPVAQGSVDSTSAFRLSVPRDGTRTVTALVLCGRNFAEVRRLSRQVRRLGPEALVRQTVSEHRRFLRPLTRALGSSARHGGRRAELAARSALVVRAHTDRGGAIIASSDSRHLHFNRDTYAYCWPRDSALSAAALDLAGLTGPTHAHYDFLARVQTEAGYLHHKYVPDGSLGSSWHPWVHWETKTPQLPIQVDETALPLWSLGHHVDAHPGCDYHSAIWPFVERAADFLVRFRDARHLPLPSYDLWEERQGVMTWSTAAVVAGLEAAARLARLRRSLTKARRWSNAAAQTQRALLRYFFDRKCRCFDRMLTPRGRRYEKDHTVEAANLAPFLFGVLPAAHPQVQTAAETIEQLLWVQGSGGIARYEGDAYFRQRKAGPGNAWIVTTLWLAQYHIARGNLRRAEALLDWVVGRATPAGLLPEQVHPVTGAPLSVLPLTWSHATYLQTFVLFERARQGIPLTMFK